MISEVVRTGYGQLETGRDVQEILGTGYWYIRYSRDRLWICRKWYGQVTDTQERVEMSLKQFKGDTYIYGNRVLGGYVLFEKDMYD